MLEIIEKGGIISWGLLFLSVFTLALILFKTFQLLSLRLGKTKFITEVLNTSFTDKNIGPTTNKLRAQKNPTAQVMAQALQLYQNGMPVSEIKEQVEVFGNVMLSRLRSVLPWLDTIAQIAPMLGLLGTVVGMIKAFKALSVAGTQIDIAMLSTGIWEALLTTAIGLVISVVALIAVNSFESKIEKTRDTMSIAVTKLINSFGG